MKVQIKTLEELGGRPESWNSEGKMDHLAGRIVNVLDKEVSAANPYYISYAIQDPDNDRRIWYIDNNESKEIKDEESSDN